MESLQKIYKVETPCQTAERNLFMQKMIYHDCWKPWFPGTFHGAGRKEKLLNQLEIFKNREFGEIRTVAIDGEPMFCLIDICKSLGMSNPTMVAQRLDEDELTKLNLGSRAGDTNFITESGLYAVILRSDKPNAKKFRKWVTSEVLPQIRKTGAYQKQMTPQEMMRVQLGMIDGHEERITHLENTMTIDYEQQQELKNTVNKRVIEVLGGKKAPAYKEMSKKVFSECNHDIQDYFRVNSRNNIPTKRYHEAIEYAEGWNPSNNTILEIRSCNAGMGGANGV